MSYRQFEYVFKPIVETATSLGSHKDVDFVEIRTAIQQLFYKNLAHETRSSSNEDGLVFVERLNLGPWFVHGWNLLYIAKLVVKKKKQKKRKCILLR